MRNLLLCLTLLPACGIIGPSVQAPHLRPLEPIPEVYASWYDHVETCIGQLGNFDAIFWYVADEIFVDGLEKAGILRFPHTITMHSDFVQNPVAVKHEMVHHVSQRGDEIHGTDAFYECA